MFDSFVRDEHDGYIAINSFGRLLLMLGIVLLGYVVAIHFFGADTASGMPWWLERFWSAAIFFWLSFALMIYGTSFADYGTAPSHETRMYMAAAIILSMASVALGIYFGFRGGTIVLR